MELYSNAYVLYYMTIVHYCNIYIYSVESILKIIVILICRHCRLQVNNKLVIKIKKIYKKCVSFIHNLEQFIHTA